MANVNVTPLMSLTNPVPGADPGPDYANWLQNSLNIIDGHNHSAGSGNQINPAGLNINTDLPINSNNLTLTRSVRMNNNGSTLTGASDLGCLYVSGGNLYYNNSAGTAVQLTSGSSPVGNLGTITGLSSPASASYTSSTFVFQSGVNTAANIDAASIILRATSASSPGLTLSPPSSISGGNETLILPSIPSGQSFLTLDQTGAIAAYASVSQGITGSNITNNVALTGKSVTAGSQNVIVSNTNPATNGLAIIRGVISSTGTIISGEGFTVGSFTSGTCVINYTTSFLGSDTQPMIIVTPYDSVTAGNVALATAVSTIYVGTVYTYGPTGSLANKAFNFMVIGQRA